MALMSLAKIIPYHVGAFIFTLQYSEWIWGDIYHVFSPKDSESGLKNIKNFWDRGPTWPWMSRMVIWFSFGLFWAIPSVFMYLHHFDLVFLWLNQLILILSTVNHHTLTFWHWFGPCIEHILPKIVIFKQNCYKIDQSSDLQASNSYLDLWTNQPCIKASLLSLNIHKPGSRVEFYPNKL